MQKKKSLNLWPYGIVISIILVAIGCGVTVYLSVKKAPYEPDNFFFERYSYVDKNINEIEQSIKEFNAKYVVDYKSISQLKVGKENIITVGITDKSGNLIEGGVVQMLLTKPQTNDNNIWLNATLSNDNFYISPAFEIPDDGRWIFMVKPSVNNVTGFFTQEIRLAH